MAESELSICVTLFSNLLFLFPLFFIIDGACGADAEVRAWMDSVANSAVIDDQNHYLNQNGYTNIGNRTNTDQHQQHITRSKRASNNYNNFRLPSEAQGRISYR